jgi:hypothetical protein
VRQLPPSPLQRLGLSEARKQGYAVDEKALADLIAWVAAKDDPAKAFATSPRKEPIVVNETPLLLALGIEAGEARAQGMQDGLKKMLTTLLRDQGKDGSRRLSHASRPLGSAPDVMTILALLALSAPNAPDLGADGKAARERGLRWLRGARPDDDQQTVVLRLILWRRLGRPVTEWEPLVNQLRAGQNADGGWGQTRGAKSDAYATGQALYALAESGAKPGDKAVRKAQSFLTKTQRPDGSWAMASRAILPSGKRVKNLEPITHAGSAWAVLGAGPDLGDAPAEACGQMNAADSRPGNGGSPQRRSALTSQRVFMTPRPIRLRGATTRFGSPFRAMVSRPLARSTATTRPR